MAERIIVGLDVGTTKICAMAAKLSERGIEVLGAGLVPSSGLRKGIVVNLEATVRSISEAVKKLESVVPIEVNSVYVGIAGGHIKAIESYGASPVKSQEVTEDDIERALEAAKAVYVPLDREVLHVVPKEYIIDGQDGIINPLGMSGVRLEVKVQIITGSVTAVQNLIKCCERAGLEVIDIVLEPLASSLAVLSEKETQDGVALVDIGGGTTDIAIYRGGSIVHTSVIAVGGNHITNDIAVGLTLPIEEAERVKRLYGSAVPVLEEETQLVEIMVGGHEPKAIPKGHIMEITVPRCEELFELIKTEMISSGMYELLNYGVVLTGGASKMNGIKKMAETVLELPVRIGTPQSRDDNTELPSLSFSARQYSDPKYSTVVGLVLYGAQNEATVFSNGDLFSAIVKRMKQWVKNIRAWPGKLF